MKYLISIIVFLLVNTGCLPKKPQPKTERVRPNIILIYGDDVGYGDVGVYGSSLIPTPNIDLLAERGIQFTDGHCTAATCTPSRFSLLTGVHGFRHNAAVLSPNAPLIIPVNMTTLPKMLKRAGYYTGIVGKWHLGLGEEGKFTNWNGAVKPGPLEVGFDYSFLLPSTNDRVPTVFLDGHHVVQLTPEDSLFVGDKSILIHKQQSTQYPDGQVNPEAMTYYRSSHGHNQSVINGIGRIGYMVGGESALWNDETITDTFVEKTKQFIRQHKKEPFFLLYSSQNIHVPRAPHPRFQGATSLGYRGDAMVQLDWAVGQIMNTLQEEGLLENSLILFSSDNGPVYDDGYQDGTTVELFANEVDRGHDASGEYRGGKYQLYEGGTRVPFIVSWLGTIKPGISHALVNQIDLMNSFAHLLNIPLHAHEGIDSQNTLDAFLGKTEQGRTYMLEEATAGCALRFGEWKYIPELPAAYGSPAMPQQLYNLINDPGEQQNVIEQYPTIAQSMAQELEKRLQE